MAEGIPARLSAAHGRRFGLTVGIAFSVVAGIVFWRDHLSAATVLGLLGGLLVIAGLVIPTYLGPIERTWMALAHAISKVTTPIVMAIMYLLVFTPIGLLRRGLGGNPLVHAPADRSYWRARREGARRSSSLERQF